VVRPMHSLEETQLAAVGRFFSSAVVQELARFGKSPLLARLLMESRIPLVDSSSERVRDLFDYGLSVLAQHCYRHEYVYKDAITRKILLGFHSLHTAVLLSEFRVGQCKADVAILNGTSTVYEIKSERDRLDRLEGQVDAYLKVFAKVNVVAGQNHVEQVFARVPKQVGVLVLSNRLSISTLRAPTEDVSRIVPSMVFDSLQLHEAAEILRRTGIDPPEVPNTERHAALRRLFVELSPPVVHDAMISVLRFTRSMARLVPFIDALPPSLRAAMLCTPLRRSDHKRVLAALDSTMQEARAWAVC
jgi:hypothetical protein